MKVAVPDSPAMWIDRVHIVDEKAYDPEIREVPVICGNKACWQQFPYYSCKVIEHKAGMTHYGTVSYFFGDTPPVTPFCERCIEKLGGVVNE